MVAAAFYFDLEDVKGAADQLIRLMTDIGLRQTLGIAAIKRVQEHFSISAMLRRYESLYSRVWNQKHGTRVEQTSH